MFAAPPFTQMPLVSIICPHCEKSAQVQVTEVARSCGCPVCGQKVMLQVGGHAPGVKRRALLVSHVKPEQPSAEELFAQRQFEGHAFDRMRADPDLDRASRRLFWGAASVAALILVAVGMSLVSRWTQPMKITQEKPTEQVVIVEKTLAERDRHLPPMISKQLDFEEIVRQRKSELARQSDENSGE